MPPRPNDKEEVRWVKPVCQQVDFKEVESIEVTPIQLSQIDLHEGAGADSTSKPAYGRHHLSRNCHTLSDQQQNQDLTTLRKSTLQMQRSEEQLVNNQEGFGGIPMFTYADSRTQLPHLLPENFSVPIWKIIGKFVTQDLTRVSLPVILNEPLNTLQRTCEQI
mmetsp:Transcript_18858/g.32230  ORF Transcript_18858/g.32230 Transcript_18858/m.32230 type:complete len:163 (-) Transcript_18858:152-640(-)